MWIGVVRFYQDDPVKCTAAKLEKFKIAKKVKKTNKTSLILDPFSTTFLTPSDKKTIKSVVGIDCSWNLASKVFVSKFLGISRKLPPLFAGNPVNYSKLNKLTTAEAIAGSLFILGENNLAQSVLDKFKWGHTFYELNEELLKDYSNMNDSKDVEEILLQYNIPIN